MGNIQFNDILRFLGPGTGQDIVWSVFLYLIFFFGLLTMLQVPDKNMVPTLLAGATILCAVIAKLNIGSGYQIMSKGEFGVFVVNVAMMPLPLLVAGMTRKTKQKKNPVPLAVITAVIAGTYFALYFLLVQRPMG